MVSGAEPVLRIALADASPDDRVAIVAASLDIALAFEASGDKALANVYRALVVEASIAQRLEDDFLRGALGSEDASTDDPA